MYWHKVKESDWVELDGGYYQIELGETIIKATWLNDVELNISILGKDGAVWFSSEFKFEHAGRKGVTMGMIAQMSEGVLSGFIGLLNADAKSLEISSIKHRLADQD